MSVLEGVALRLMRENILAGRITRVHIVMCVAIGTSVRNYDGDGDVDGDGDGDVDGNGNVKKAIGLTSNFSAVPAQLRRKIAKFLKFTYERKRQGA